MGWIDQEGGLVMSHINIDQTSDIVISAMQYITCQTSDIMRSTMQQHDKFCFLGAPIVHSDVEVLVATAL